MGCSQILDREITTSHQPRRRELHIAQPSTQHSSRPRSPSYRALRDLTSSREYEPVEVNPNLDRISKPKKQPSPAMAAAVQHLRLAPSLPSLLPRFSAPTTVSSPSRWAALYAHKLARPLLPALAVGIAGLRLGLPALLGDIWESVLRAVPKKKTSHSKKRHRQMAGKALEDVNALCRCPGCGQTKRMHRLCPHCMESM
jgi:large subunit ribosomal protein L32